MKTGECLDSERRKSQVFWPDIILQLVVDSSSSEGAHTAKTESGISYTPHSTIHKGIIEASPTKLAMLDCFEKTEAGYQYIPSESEVRVIITGRDWSEKRALIYGCKSTKEASRYLREVIERIEGIGHDAEQKGDLEITNIAVSGDFHRTLQLERVTVTLESTGIEVEYEPEQFPAAILRLEEPDATFLLFSTGKFTIQGLVDFDEIEPTIEQVYKLLDNNGLI